MSFSLAEMHALLLNETALMITYVVMSVLCILIQVAFNIPDFAMARFKQYVLLTNT